MQPNNTMLPGREKRWDQIPSEEIKVEGNVAGAGDCQSTRIIAPEDDATDKILQQMQDMEERAASFPVDEATRISNDK